MCTIWPIKDLPQNGGGNGSDSSDFEVHMQLGDATSSYSILK